MSADALAPLYAALYRPPPAAGGSTLAAIAADFSPRFEVHRDDLIAIDVSGLGRLLGEPRAIGEQLRRSAAERGLRVHVAVAGTRMAALVLAQARPGFTLVERGEEAAALAAVPISMFDLLTAPQPPPAAEHAALNVDTLKRWGIRTFGEFAAIPAADLSARLGQRALAWQAIARGDDVAPLVPALEEERFESSLDLEWPIDGLEPLSFVLTRLLEPLSTRLERRDRGAAVLNVVLRLVTRDNVLRRLQLPSPMRDVRTLRTLALLDLESHPPGAAIDRVQVVIDPTPARVLQHTLFTRAQPTVEQLSTLLARLAALMGQDRIGAATTMDSYRPGGFAMKPFAADHADPRRPGQDAHDPRGAAPQVVSALRRCRPPVPARVVLAAGRPARVTTDRRGFTGGAVLQCAGPWRTSGDWWAAAPPPWDRDEWDVALGDGAVYRIFCDRHRDAWFIEAIVD